MLRCVIIQLRNGAGRDGSDTAVHRLCEVGVPAHSRTNRRPGHPGRPKEPPSVARAYILRCGFFGHNLRFKNTQPVCRGFVPPLQPLLLEPQTV
jgi:hypothetical protein